jgi:hypothetical protein
MFACVVVALLALGPGLQAGDALQVTGQVTATEQEADEGYFAVGQETMVVAKPGTGMHTWLKSQIGQQVTVSIGKVSPR